MTGLAGHRTLAAEGARSSSATALTEVELIWIEKSIEYWVRFGKPVQERRPSVLPRERISTLYHSRALLAEIDTISRQASSISPSWRNRMRPDSLGSRVSFHFPEANKRARKPGRYVCARPDNNLLNATFDMPEHPDSKG